MAFGASSNKPTLSIKGRALRYLAQREHSRAELERKLLRPPRRSVLAGSARGEDESVAARLGGGPIADTKTDAQAGADGDDIQADAPTEFEHLRELVRVALDELSAKGLLSDQRTADSVLRSQGERFGARRVRQTLQSKGLSPELVSSTLQQARHTELDRARAVWKRRYGTPATDAAGRAKQMRFLASRGFDADVVRRVLRDAQAALPVAAHETDEDGYALDTVAGSDSTD